MTAPIPVFVEFLGTITGLKGAIDGAEAEMSRLSRSGASTMTKVSALSKAAVAAIGVAAVGVGVMSVTAAAKFQASMEQIHTQAGVAQDQVDKLSKAVLNLAPQVGTGPDDLAVGLYHLESSLSRSMPTAQRYKTAMAELRIAAEGAKVGGANLEDVTNALNATVASGIPGVENLDQAMGALNATVGAGDMHMQDLADAMGTGMLAVVKGFGLSLNDVGAALATLGDNNIRGADAATALRMAVMAMAAPAKGGAKALAEIGVTSSQLGKDMQTGGLNKALTDLHTHLVKSGDAGVKAGELLTTAFGKKAGVGIQVLVSQYDRFESKTKEVADGAGGFSEAWSATTKTFAFQFDQAKATVEALAIRIGMFLIPWVEKAAKAFESGITWLQKHKAVAEALGVALGTVLVGALVVATAAMVSFTVSLVTNPVFLIVAAVAALGVGIFELVKHWNTVWNAIKTVTVEAWHWIDGNVFQPIGNFFSAVWNAILTTAQDVWTTTWGVIQAVIAPFIAAFDGARDIVVGAWHLMDEAFQFVADHWQKIVKIILAVVLGPIGIAIDILWTHWKTIWNFIKDLLSTVWDFLRDDIFKPLVTFLNATIVQPLEALGRLFKSVWDAIKTAVSTVWNWLKSNVFDPIVNVIKVGLTAELNGLKRVFDDVWGGIKTAVSTVWNWLRDNVFNPLVRVVKEGLVAEMNGLKRVFKDVWDAIQHAVTTVWNVIKPIINAIKDAVGAVGDVIGKVAGGVKDVVGGISHGIGAVGHFLGFAGGTDFAPGGLAIVGENGPELVNLPRGSQVVPNHVAFGDSAALSAHSAASRREAQARQDQHDRTNQLLAAIQSLLESQPRDTQTLMRKFA